MTLRSADILKLPRTEVHAVDREGKEVTFSATSLAEVLQAAGMKFDPGPMPSRSAVASYASAEAADGYKAVFSLAEIDPAQSRQVIELLIIRTASCW